MHDLSTPVRHARHAYANVIIIIQIYLHKFETLSIIFLSCCFFFCLLLNVFYPDLVTNAFVCRPFRFAPCPCSIFAYVGNHSNWRAIRKFGAPSVISFGWWRARRILLYRRLLSSQYANDWHCRFISICTLLIMERFIFTCFTTCLVYIMYTRMSNVFAFFFFYNQQISHTCKCSYQLWIKS